MHLGNSGLIDVHHHFVPPFYLKENRRRITDSRGGKLSPAWLEWAPQGMLDAMDAHRIATTVLSISTPGVWFGDAQEARKTARKCNEYAADLRRRFPGRFDLFAAIALPDVDGALREIEYAFDVLKAAGIGILTSYDAKWLGHPDYFPVFAELNRRKAVVFVHPTTPTIVRALLPDVPPVIAEVPQDTTRAILNLLLTGCLSRYQDLRFVFSHAGGTMPMILGRVLQYASKSLLERIPNGIEYELRRHYYDIAGTTYRPAIAALTNLVPSTQILFGSDEPHVPLSETVEGLARLGLSATDVQSIRYDNAIRLLPILRAT
jgi:predicted TIM-barrel fold metal-dependent hydrolase